MASANVGRGCEARTVWTTFWSRSDANRGSLTRYPTGPVMASATSPGLWHPAPGVKAAPQVPSEAGGPEARYGDPVPRNPLVDEHVVDDLAAIARVHGLVLELVDRGSGRRGRCRFYSLHLQPALFGCCHLVRSWGRLGHRHRARQLVTCHPTVDSAHSALRPVVQRRLRRGYQPSAECGP
jgi:predicted DNA-binding WGR domain protein